jgi:hypothetical protein
MSTRRKWRLWPSVTYTNYRKACPTLGPGCFRDWLAIRRYWSGRIISVCVRHHELSFDFRRNWIADMVNL